MAAIGRSGELQPRAYRRHRFPQRYTRADIELLAAVDEAHETLSGPATRRILEREYHAVRQAGVRAAGRDLGGPPVQPAPPGSAIANGVSTTAKPGPRPWPSASGGGPIRKASPAICASIPCIRAISPAAKGVYHINAVDEVTQWQIVAATAHISEAWLEPVLAAMLRQFPFRIRGFHSDNGSEFINQTVAHLLQQAAHRADQKPAPAQQR